MATKRGAGTELNHDNWNDEYIPESAGVFKQADSSQISQRKIIKAKRRVTSEAPKNANPFGNLSFVFGSTNPSPQQPQAQSSSPHPETSNEDPKVSVKVSSDDKDVNPGLKHGDEPPEKSEESIVNPKTQTEEETGQVAVGELGGEVEQPGEKTGDDSEVLISHPQNTVPQIDDVVDCGEPTVQPENLQESDSVTDRKTNDESTLPVDNSESERNSSSPSTKP